MILHFGRHLLEHEQFTTPPRSALLPGEACTGRYGDIIRIYLFRGVSFIYIVES